jgi:hypothetical protein
MTLAERAAELSREIRESGHGDSKLPGYCYRCDSRFPCDAIRAADLLDELVRADHAYLRIDDVRCAQCGRLKEEHASGS